jgi:hypothetical protein
LLLAPVEDDLLASEDSEEFLCHLLHLRAFGVRQVGCRTHQQVEDGELFLTQAFGQRSTLFLVQRLLVLEEFLEERRGIYAAGVVVRDKLLEPLLF